jgi:O-antigen/teichoic acid export membrane protein
MSIKFHFKELINYKFVKDSIYTFISFIILAISGIASNIIIGNYYQASGLGIFNQTVALYMIFSIISVIGLNTSVIKFVSQFKQNQNIQKEIFTTASILVISFSVLLTVFLLLLSYLSPGFFFNKDVTKSTIIILLSLPLLSQNKIFMALLNALRHIKTYAIVQSARWILVIGFISVSIFFNKSVYFLAFSFLFSELALFTYFMLFYHHYISLKYIRSPWYKTNLTFGGKTILLSFLSEANNKIDIFFIGFFLSNYYVGIYSFAAEIAKGFLNIASVIQININPIVAELWEKKDIVTLKEYTLRISKMIYIIILPIILLAVIFYPVFLNLFMSDKSYLESIPVFYILLIGVLVAGLYFFAGAYLIMANFLNVSFKYLIIIIIYNALSCIIFVNIFGFYGAAISTSSTYLLSVALMHYYIKKEMNIKLINFKK